MEDIFAQKEVIHFSDRNPAVSCELVRSSLWGVSQIAGAVFVPLDGRKRVQGLDWEDAGAAPVFLRGDPPAAAVSLRVTHRQEAEPLWGAASLE